MQQLNVRVHAEDADRFRQACKAARLTQAEGFSQAVRLLSGEVEGRSSLEARVLRLEEQYEKP